MEFRVQMEPLRFVVADVPEQRRDFESGTPKTNGDGDPVFGVRLLVMDGAGSAPIRVSVAGDPGLSQGAFVRPVGLVLNVVDRRGDSVTWWTAERFETEEIPGGGTSAGAADAPAGSAAAAKAAGKAAGR